MSLHAGGCTDIKAICMLVVVHFQVYVNSIEIMDVGILGFYITGSMPN